LMAKMRNFCPPLLLSQESAGAKRTICSPNEVLGGFSTFRSCPNLLF
jgi:hypothetical protein